MTSGRYYRAGGAVAGLMIVLALVGVGLTTTDRAAARWYWMCLVPAYGVLCIATAWLRSRHDRTIGLGAVGRQVLHWLTITAAVAFDFWISRTGEQAGAAAGFNALLLLAVGCVLAGVHLDWLLAVVGALLALTLACIVKADQYLWLILVAGALFLVVIVIAGRLVGGSSARPAGP
jgi:hypothetical protein